MQSALSSLKLASVECFILRFVGEGASHPNLTNGKVLAHVQRPIDLSYVVSMICEFCEIHVPQRTFDRRHAKAPEEQHWRLTPVAPWQLRLMVARRPPSEGWNHTKTTKVLSMEECGQRWRSQWDPWEKIGDTIRWAFGDAPKPFPRARAKTFWSWRPSRVNWMARWTGPTTWQGPIWRGSCGCKSPYSPFKTK